MGGVLCWFALQKPQDGLPKFWAQLQIVGLFLHYRSPSAGTFFVAFCPAADISLQPARLIRSENPPEVSLLRVLNVLHQYL